MMCFILTLLSHGLLNIYIDHLEIVRGCPLSPAYTYGFHIVSNILVRFPVLQLQEAYKIALALIFFSQAFLLSKFFCACDILAHA